MTQGAIYLTFDDGPLAGTDDVVAVLTEKEVKGTLFLVGGHVVGQRRTSLLNVARSTAYVEIANHSQTHANGRYAEYYADPSAVVAGFKEASEVLGLTGPGIPARLPGRNTWRVGSISANDLASGAAADLLAAEGYVIYGWDVEWRMRQGSPAQTPEEVHNEITTALESGRTRKANKVIVLAHDVMFRASRGNRTKLATLIDLLKGDGHTFEFVSEY